MNTYPSPRKQTISPRQSTSHVKLPIPQLPNEILLRIFLHLSTRDLNNIRLVCQRFYDLSTKTWLSKQNLSLNEEDIFGMSLSSSTSQRNVSFHKIYAQILSKINGSKLKRLEIATSNNFRSLLSAYELAKFLELVRMKCTSLTHLSLKSCLKFSKFSIFPNNNFSKLVRQSPHLVHVDLNNSFGIVDSSIEVLFDSCANLRSINLTNSNLLIGICFKKVRKCLERITLDYCMNIREENLVKLFNQCQTLSYLSINGVEIGPRVFYHLITNLKTLKVLKISNYNFNNPSNNILMLNQSTEHLTKLDLSYNFGNNQLFASILNKCTSLKCLNVDFCQNLTDEMFTSFPINAPLEQLNLTGLSITDLTLRNLGERLRTSLKCLSLRKCRQLSSRGIGHLLEIFTNLRWIDLRETQTNNFALHILSCSSIQSRPNSLRVLAQDTQLDIFEINILYPSWDFSVENLEVSNLAVICPELNEYYSTDMQIKFFNLIIETTRPEFSLVYEIDWISMFSTIESKKSQYTVKQDSIFKRMNPSEKIPNNIWMKIFYEFSVKELCGLSRVCEKFSIVCQLLIRYLHKNLECLNLFGTIGENSLFSGILNSLISLRILNLEFCTNIDDRAFTMATINCPLEELYLSNLNISDFSLECLHQLRDSLRKLVIKNCKRLSNVAIAMCLEKMANLAYFDVRNTNADNLLLKTALSFSKRKIYILCQNTSIEVFAFLKDFQNTEKEFLNSSDVLFRHRNLSFEYSIECI